MGDYIKNKKKMNFQSFDSLKPVQNVLDEADKALNDKTRRIEDSPISEVLAGALGTGAGAGIGFAGLYFGGSVAGLSAAGISSGLATAGALVGGGMAAGVAVLAAPAVILGGATILYVTHKNAEKLRQAKELTYKNALAKQTSILKVLKEKSNADKKRIDHLTSLNIILESVIKDLVNDLGYTE